MNKRKITKVSSGLILKDDFNNSFNPLWDFFPNNMKRVLFAKDSILLLPEKDSPMEMIIPVPNNGEFVMQTELIYKPTAPNEFAGCLIKSITDNKVECEISYNPDETEQYKFIKISCNSSYIINLRASKDGEIWDDLGNTKFFDGNYIGYFINGEKSGLAIKECTMCKSSFIVIHGINSEDKVLLNNSDGVDLITKLDLDTSLKGDRFIIDLGPTMLPLRDIALTVLSPNGTTYTMLDEIYGGDVFKINPDIQIYVEKYSEECGTFNLGEIIGEEQIFTLVLENKSDTPKNGIIKVEALSSYECGHKMASLAPLDRPELNLKSLKDVSIQPKSDFKCLLKVKNNENFLTIDDDYKFSIIFV